MVHRIIVLLILVLAGCTAPSTPSITPTPEPSSTLALATSTAAPFTAIPPAVQWNNEELLSVYPLKQGAQWVYREERYDTIPNEVLPSMQNRQFTMTVTITDTVTETEMGEGRYAAQVVRTRSVLSSSIYLDELGEARELFVPDETPFAKWYIFEKDRIFSQLDFLDWTALDSSLLEYQFPFKEGECWYPDPTAPRTCPVNEPPWYVGYRIVQPLEAQHTPGGDYTNCYSIQEIYNSGPTILRFCDGVGVVGEDYDHSGTPFGSHSVLVKFSPGIE